MSLHFTYFLCRRGSAIGIRSGQLKLALTKHIGNGLTRAR